MRIDSLYQKANKIIVNVGIFKAKTFCKLLGNKKLRKKENNSHLSFSSILQYKIIEGYSSVGK
jgi:hypothetical protein